MINSNKIIICLLNKQMSHTRQTFLIPQLNVVANDAQLKNLQRKVLIDSYYQQNQQKINRSESQRKIYRNYSNPESRVDTDMGILRNSTIQQIKNYKKDLAESYDQEIKRKQMKRMQQRGEQLKQQQQMIDRAKYQMYQDRARVMQLHQGFKRQALQLLQYKQQRKAQEKRKQQEEKAYFQKRYQSNLLSLNKQKSFQDHYQNVDGALQKNYRNYLNNVMPKNNQIEKQKWRFVQLSLQDSERKMRQQVQREKNATLRHKHDLKNELVNQIRQKQQKKKLQKYLERSQGYTSQVYLKQHHPINNPVDFKITHDNKYIIKELHTGLARRGSQSLLS